MSCLFSRFPREAVDELLLNVGAVLRPLVVSSVVVDEIPLGVFISLTQRGGLRRDPGHGL